MKNLFLFAFLFFNVSMFQAQNPLTIIAPTYFLNDIPIPLPQGPNQTDYKGEIAQCSSNAFADAQGELKFFIVDDKIFDREGFLIGDLSVGFTSGTTLRKGRTELAVVPDPTNCEKFNIFTVGRNYSNILDGDSFNHATLDFSDFSLENSNRFGLLIVGNDFLNSGNKVANGHISISKPRLDKSHFVFISTTNSLRKYLLNGSTLSNSFSNIILNANSFYGNIRAEMELFESADPNSTFKYRIAVPVYTDAFVGTQLFEYHKVYVADLNLNGDLIPGTEHYYEYELVTNPDNNERTPFIHGLEFDPTGRFLFISHTFSDVYFSAIDYVDLTLNTNQIFNLNQPLTENFQFSQIERLNLFGVDALYMINETKMGRIITGADPSTFVFQSNVFNQGISPSFMSLNLLFPEQNFEKYRTYLLPDQIDGYNYNDFYFVDKPIECCKINTTYNKESFTATTTATWTATNNPLESGSTNVATIRDELRIARGTVVTINGMVLKFAPGAKLIIEQGNGTLTGGRLNLIGTTLTSDERCGQFFWEGVEVRGVTTQNQGAVGGSSSINISQQARLVVSTNSKIENARIGAMNAEKVFSSTGTFIVDANKIGGIIQSTNGTFRNNVVDVAFRRYSNPDGTNDKSFFNNTVFKTDGLLYENKNPDSHVTLGMVKGISFRGCDFRNEVPGLYSPFNRGNGIVASNSSFNVLAQCTNLPCTTFDPNVFENLNGGILVSTFASLLSFKTDRSQFINNNIGVLATGVKLAEITRNTFRIPEVNSVQTGGVNFNRCTQYSIQENLFTSLLTNPNPNSTTYGLVINSSGAEPNLVYKNNFEKLTIGGQSERTNALNKENETRGLLWKCNQFNGIFKNDLTVFNGNIVFNQGMTDPSSSIFAIQKAANNQFSLTGEDPSLNHDYFLFDSEPINYVHVSGAGLKPDSYSTDLMTVQESMYQGMPVTYNPSIGCPSRLLTDRTSIQIQTERAAIEEQIALQLGRIDAGSTENLVAYVNSGLIGTKKVLLTAISPYLSDEVLIAYLNRVPAADDIQSIILSNSPVSSIVVEKLATMTLPLNVRSSINAAQDGSLSKRSLLYQDVYYLTNNANDLTDGLIRAVIFDTSFTRTYNDAISVLETQTADKYKELLISGLILNNQLAEAESMMSSISNYGNTMQLASIQKQLRNVISVEDYFIQNPSSLNVLDNLIADETDPVTAGRSQAVKDVFNPIDFTYSFATVPQSQNLRNGLVEEQQDQLSNSLNQLIVYPNPTSNSISVQLKSFSSDGMKFKLVDLTGKELLQAGFSETIIELSLLNLKNGVYLGQLINPNGTVQEIVRVIKN